MPDLNVRVVCPRFAKGGEGGIRLAEMSSGSGRGKSRSFRFAGKAGFPSSRKWKSLPVKFTVDGVDFAPAAEGIKEVESLAWAVCPSAWQNPVLCPMTPKAGKADRVSNYRAKCKGVCRSRFCCSTDG